MKLSRLTDDTVSRFVSPVIICVSIETEHGRLEDDPPDSDIISTDANAPHVSTFLFP